ncbi:MAG: DUF447 family protein [Candidatus Thiodiazotropha sp. (ex Lucinoma annulata)]|nr:DUF447 family protein [Candidatus Thiodiazotropha sp. (ex Lucinoma borealis)]MCU7854084.1 DUF447 family protein [Candidatus Thiodiazotropha sp. (ex Lucinoma borealis)]MCU7866342.1 DUF447 family protein [Candidatus Thiodiazotropha sp. (ex Lucinoma borealis)]MCU7868525.1 DUF447 family protein [Candidatus Thiodiazotropha sp. (ex Lucinoma borealis)]MCU7886176.1 DUF447 family protein [Candidatus Thiodiazotropha sp. (ex Lucinoma annulata)]
MEYICHEVFVITHTINSTPHIVPMGQLQPKERLVIAPFCPSRTLNNLLWDGYLRRMPQ